MYALYWFCAGNKVKIFVTNSLQQADTWSEQQKWTCSLVEGANIINHTQGSLVWADCLLLLHGTEAWFWLISCWNLIEPGPNQVRSAAFVTMVASSGWRLHDSGFMVNLTFFTSLASWFSFLIETCPDVCAGLQLCSEHTNSTFRPFIEWFRPAFLLRAACLLTSHLTYKPFYPLPVTRSHGVLLCWCEAESLICVCRNWEKQRTNIKPTNKYFISFLYLYCGHNLSHMWGSIMTQVAGHHKHFQETYPLPLEFH